jgi:uncharacterized protein GlcG (DUF336 family)
MGTTVSGVSRRAALRGMAGLAAAGAGAGLAARAAHAQEATPEVNGGQLTVGQVSLAQAHALVDAAVAESEALGLRMVIAVVDAGANLVALARMDGAWLASVDVAIKKARTSALIPIPTGDLGPLVQPGASLYGAEITNEGLITFPGGLPLSGTDGTPIGAIGVSGSTVEDDLAVAEAAVAALGGP